MSNLYVASEYKNKIINLLIKNKDFVKLLNPTPSKCSDIDIVDVLLGGEWIIKGKKYTEQGYIFDYNFVDETTTDDKTYVFVETDLENITDGIFMDFNLYICVFTKKDMVRLTTTTQPTAKEVADMGYFASSTANRIDVLCDIIDRTLNKGSNKIHGIGDIALAPRGAIVTYLPQVSYYGKMMKYHVKNYYVNGESCEDN